MNQNGLSYWLPPHFGRWFSRLVRTYILIGLAIGGGTLIAAMVMSSTTPTFDKGLALLAGIVAVYLIREWAPTVVRLERQRSKGE